MNMRMIHVLVVVATTLIATPQTLRPPVSQDSEPRKAAPKNSGTESRYIENGSAAVRANPNQPHRPVPMNRASSRETIFEFYLRALNPRRIHWGDEIDHRLAALAAQSIENPYFRVSAMQTGTILLLLLVCWVWWDEMRQIKWVAAECLTDAINAKIISERRALEAIDQYNRHIEMCNRVVEGQESGLPGTSSADGWRQEVFALKNKLTAEEAKSQRLQKTLEERIALQADMEQRLRQLEAATLERQNGVSAELVARLQRAEAELSNRKIAKR
jgi:hypothetical protein